MFLLCRHTIKTSKISYNKMNLEHSYCWIWTNFFRTGCINSSELLTGNTKQALSTCCMPFVILCQLMKCFQVLSCHEKLSYSQKIQMQLNRMIQIFHQPFLRKKNHAMNSRKIGTVRLVYQPLFSWVSPTWNKASASFLRLSPGIFLLVSRLSL